MKNPFVIRPYNLGELARIYKVSRPTMKKWLSPYISKLGAINSRIFTSNQVGKIFKFLGLPERKITSSDRL